jgi:hypothetical protein
MGKLRKPNTAQRSNILRQRYGREYLQYMNENTVNGYVFLNYSEFAALRGKGTLAADIPTHAQFTAMSEPERNALRGWR